MVNLPRCAAYPVGVLLFLSPKGDAKRIQEGSNCIFGLGKVYWISKINKVYRVFFLRENVLSPEGKCIAYPVGVQLFLLIHSFGQDTYIAISKSLYYGDFFFFQSSFPNSK